MSDVAFQSQSLIGEPNRVRCDDRGCRIADDDLVLRFKSGDGLDLVEVDRVLADVLGLDVRKIVVAVEPRAAVDEVAREQGLGKLDGYWKHSPDFDHYIAIADDCPDPARTLLHEGGHVRWYEDMLEGEKAAGPLLDEFDRYAEEVAGHYELLAPQIRERVILPARAGGAARASGGGRIASAPAAKSSNRPPDYEWPVPQRRIREMETGALQRING